MTIMSTQWWVPEGSAQIRFGDIAPALLSAWRGGGGGPDHALARRVVDHLNATGFTPEEGTGMSSHAAQPTEEDVRRLVALIDEGQYHDSAIHPGSMARRLLAAGVTLPPEPDTPPEPLERYYVDQREVHRHLVFTGDSKIERLVAECFTSDDAELIASLLNLDESVKDDVCSGLHEAYPALVEARERAEACVGDPAGWMRVVEAERDEARAEVERLTAELAWREAWENELAVELPEDWDDDSAQSHIIAEYVREMGRRLSAAGISRHRFVDEAPAVPQDDGPTEPPHEFQGHPGDVCTSCDCQMETGNHLRPTEPLFTGHIGGHGWQSGRDEYVTVEAPAGPDARVHRSLGMEVAVFPLGHGPTNQPVTAEMVYEAIEAAGVRDGLDRGDGPAYIRPCDWTIGEASVVADALNDKLDRTPPPQEDDDAR